jgi:PKD repeat protein
VRAHLSLVAGAFLGACGGRGPTNVSPAVTFAVSPPGVAIVGVTAVTFLASATDPDGGALNYRLDFGDGTSASSAAATHVYQTEGTFPVALTVRDEGGGSTTVTTAVTVGSLSGRWLLSEGGGRFYERGYDLVQRGAALTGLPFSDADKHCLGEIGGLVVSPRTLSFEFVGCDREVVVINGTAAETLLTITGTYTHPSGPPQPITLSR